MNSNLSCILVLLLLSGVVIEQTEAIACMMGKSDVLRWMQAPELRNWKLPGGHCRSFRQMCVRTMRYWRKVITYFVFVMHSW